MKLKLILPILLLLGACNNVIPKKVNSTNSSELLKEIEFYESLIPEDIKNESLMIWRVGSIQWSSNASVLIFPNKNKTTKGNCFYIQFDYTFYSNLNEEIMRMYNLNIEADIRAFKASNLSLVPVDYLIQKGEGYCANQYFIKKADSDSMCLINDQTNLSNKVMAIFKQISAQEHFQSYSLYPDCEKYSASAYGLLEEGKNEEMITYKLPFVAPVKL